MSSETGMLGHLERSLSDTRAVRMSESDPAAAVAAILVADDDPSLLFIQRVSHDRDPWSGHIAFPGGRIEESDQTSRAAAERETQEEIGLDLREASRIGRLADITGSTIPLCVACHVYGIGALPPLDLNYEVEDAFDIRLSSLADRQRWLEADFEIKGERRSYPAIDLGIEGKPLLWGLTYRFVLQILTHSGLASDG